MDVIIRPWRNFNGGLISFVSNCISDKTVGAITNPSLISVAFSRRGAYKSIWIIIKLMVSVS